MSFRTRQGTPFGIPLTSIGNPTSPSPALTAPSTTTMVASNGAHEEAPNATAHITNAQLNALLESINTLSRKVEGLAAVQPAPAVAVQQEELPTEGDLSPEAKGLLTLAPGAPPEQLNQVVKGNFNPWNMVKLCPELADWAEEVANSNVIISEEGVITTRKVNRSAKDYGKDPIVWAISFIIYKTLVYHLHSAKHPTMEAGMTKFIHTILSLSRIYIWSQVLQMAMSHQQSVTARGMGDGNLWTIPRETKDNHCKMTINENRTLAKVAGFNTQGTARQNQGQFKRPRLYDTNDNGNYCHGFNKGNLCHRAACSYPHKCTKCNGPHPASSCRS